MKDFRSLSPSPRNYVVGVTSVNTYYATPICLMSLSRWNCKASVFRWIGSSIVWLNFSPLCIEFNSRSSKYSFFRVTLASLADALMSCSLACILFQVWVTSRWNCKQPPGVTPIGEGFVSPGTKKIFGYQTMKLWWSWEHELFLGLEADTAQPVPLQLQN